MKNLLGALIALAATPLGAASVSVKDCDGSIDRVWNLQEPWEKNSRRFYNDKVRIGYLDTGGEPVCCSGWLIVIMPNKVEENEPMEGPVCKLIGGKEGNGFLGVGFNNLKAKYDAAKGLLITFPYTEYNDDGENHFQRTGRFRLNLKDATVKPE